MLDDNGSFSSLSSFRAKFNIQTNFTEYGAVVRLVKARYRDVLTNNNNIPLSFNMHFLLSDKKGSWRLYNLFVSAKTVARKFVDKWERQLELNYDFDVWSPVFIVPFTCTMNSKFKWFQFTLIHRVLSGH